MTALGILLGQRNPLRRRRAGGGVGARAAVTFPTTNLVTRVQIALGADLSADPGSWNWADITNYVRHDLGISLTTGRRDESTHVSTGMAQMKLDNRDGRFTRRNPNSPYYGLLSKNTPIWATVDAGSGEKTRLEMFVNEWPTRWTDKSGTDSTVTIQCAGIMRRLALGKVIRSAPYRYLSGLATSTPPVAAWTLEDGPLVGNAAALYGSYALAPWTGTHPSGAVASYPKWGSGNLGPWLPSVVSRTGSSGLTIIAGTVSMPAFTTTWTVDLMYASGTDAGHDTVDGIAATVDINPSYLPGGALGWPQLIFMPDVETIQVAMNGEPETSTTVSGLYDGIGHHIRWTAAQSGGNVAWTVYVDGVSVQTDTTAGAMTLTAVTSIGLPAAGLGGSQMAQGYVAIWTTPPPLADAVAAARGHTGEEPHVRIARLCAEEGIVFTLAG